MSPRSGSRATLLLIPLVAGLLLACASPGAPAAGPAAGTSGGTPAAGPARGEGGAAPAAQPAPRKLRVATALNVTSAPLLLAMEKGYFGEERIEIDIVPMSGGAEMVAPLSTGELDVGMGGISASLFNALARGIDSKIVSDFSRMTRGHGFGAFLARRDFEMPTMAALRGQRVGFNNPGAPCHYMVGRMLELNGMSVADIEVVNMPFNTLPGAMAKREIEAACAAEPWVTNTLRTGDARLVMTYDEILPDMQVSVIMISNQLAADRAFTERFLAAFLKAVPISREKTPETLEVVSRYTQLDVNVLRDTIWTDLDTNGRVNVDSIKDQQDFFVRAGLVPTPADIDRIVDMSYLPRR